MPSDLLPDQVLPIAASSEEQTTILESQLRLALQCAGMGCWTYDPATRIFTVDERVQELLGAKRRTEDLGYWLEYLHPDDRDRVAQQFEDAIAGLDTYDLEYRVLHPDGERWLRSKGQVVGKPAVMIFAVVEDYTFRKKMAEELRVSEEAMRLAQESAGIASWDWDLTTGKFKWHPRGTQVYGRPATQLENLETILEYIHEEDRERVKGEGETALRGKGDFHTDYRVTWPDGSLHWLIVRGELVSTADNKPHLMGVTMDVTEQREMDAMLRQNEKLAAVGKLASSMAHELNNPLASVTNLLFLVRGSSDLHQIQEYAETAERELRRVSQIANQTLKFRKKQSAQASFYCQDLIGEALSAFQGRLVNRHIQVEKRKRAIHPVQCFGDEIRQVLGNLIGNAIDAMPLGGRLVVRSREATNWTTGKRGIVLTVADTGTGMSKATQKRVFDAFFTTKGIGGTGLGLWLSTEIVQRHHGSIRMRSSEVEGKSGTVFTVFLPLDQHIAGDPE